MEATINLGKTLALIVALLRRRRSHGFAGSIGLSFWGGQTGPTTHRGASI